VNANDYYPFGMVMPGRKFSAGSLYRYGFNGKEKDNDINSLTVYDYGFRIYNPGIGRFLSVDPLTKKYPELTSYQFAGNKPIKYIDMDGAEPEEDDIEELEREGEEVKERIRENLREREERERETHIRRMTNDPAYRARDNFIRGMVQSQAKESYWRSAFGAARFILTGGGVQENKKNGDAWDDFVKDEMLKNPNCVGVGRQISVKVVGLVNGKTEVANIRIDNVGIRVDATGKPILDFKEAKFSIGEIKDGNVIQTLTPQQKAAVNILINGSNVDIFVRGEGSAQKLNSIFFQNGIEYKVANGQSVLGRIGEVKIVVPARTGTTPSTTNTNTNSSTTQSQQTLTNGQESSPNH
jgi:RHS repeat-associated protein